MNLLNKKCKWNKQPKQGILSTNELRAFKDWLCDNFVNCQICNEFKPYEFHHSAYGCKKDDRTLVKICVDCHRAIHSGAMKIKSRTEILKLGKENYQCFLKNYLAERK